MRKNIMVMGKILLTFMFVMVFLCCATPVKYSPDEIKEYPPSIQEHIKNGEVVTGMTPQQVRYSWGSPTTINVLQPVDGKYKEEWIYTKIGIFKTRLIFIDGKLAHIITNEPGIIKK